MRLTHAYNNNFKTEIYNDFLDHAIGMPAWHGENKSFLLSRQPLLAPAIDFKPNGDSFQLEVCTKCISQS